MRDRLILLGLTTLTLFLRLWKIEERLIFLGDEGRDVLVVKRILEGKFTLLGPTASVGGFYLGPIYYYFIAPFLWLFRFNPVGPAVLVVLFSVATVVGLFLFAREFLGWRVGLVASLIYTLSPLTIKYGQSSWNPNPLPFFSLLLVAAMAWAVRTGKWWPAIWSGFAWGVALQLHYLALILGPIAVILAMLEPQLTLVFKRWLGFLGGTLIGFAPFLLFELRHGFPNSLTIWRFLTQQDTNPVGFQSPLALIAPVGTLEGRLGAWFFGYEPTAGMRLLLHSASAFLLLLTLTLLVRRRRDRLGILTLSSWWFLGLAGLALYQGQVYDYYFAFLFPATALVVGNFLGKLLTWFPINLFGLIITAYLLGYLVGVLPFRVQGNNQLEQTRQIAAAVLEHSQGKEFNFALLSRGNSDHAYRYFFEVWGKRPLPLDVKVTPQLMVVCEEKECPVLGHPLWEIAAFGRAEVTGVWRVKGGVKVLKLVHHPDSIGLIGGPAVKG